jgi:hypothetical protein
MAKIKDLKGFLRVVMPVQKLSDAKETPIQYLVIEVPAYVNSFGEKQGKDQQWLIQILGEKRINDFNINQDHINKKVEIDIFTESFCIESKTEGKNPFYVVNNTLSALKILG